MCIILLCKRSLLAEEVLIKISYKNKSLKLLTRYLQKARTDSKGKVRIDKILSLFISCTISVLQNS